MNIPNSKILYERQGKIFAEAILYYLKLLLTFLRGQLLSNSQNYSFMKSYGSVIQPSLDVLSITENFTFVGSKIFKLGDASTGEARDVTSTNQGGHK